MGRSRQPLPEVPLFILSRQQRAVYSLSSKHSTVEIAQILSIPEKQVRQVYSDIRSKSREFANKNVPPDSGAEPAHYGPPDIGTEPINYNFIRELMENNGLQNFTPSELFVLEQVKKGVSIRKITELNGKSIQSARKTYQRANTKLRKSYGFYDDNCITIDTGKTYVKINGSIIRSALEKINLTGEQIFQNTGISPERMKEIESRGTVTYDELFILIRELKINPYGPSEKDQLLKKLRDQNWIKVVRAGSAGSGHQFTHKHLRQRISRDKSRYRNRVMYYGSARFRHNGFNRDRPTVEDGRNGLFPLVLTRKQQGECAWILKKFMIRPVYTYRYPGLNLEIARLQKELAGEKDQSRADKYRRKIMHLREDIMPEDGKSIFIINKSYFVIINEFLSHR